MHTNHRLARRAETAAVALFLATLAMPSQAHETWLLPADFTPPAGESLTFTITSGMAFPAPGSGIDRRRITEAKLIQAGDASALVPSGGDEGILELTAIPSAGAACALVRLRPRVLDIEDPESVVHYLEEIGAPDAVWSAWRASRGQAVWRESYSKLARSYLVAEGNGHGAPCWKQASSARFDIVPLGDPTALRNGDALELQVLFDGEPLAGQAVGFVREGAKPNPLVRSDDRGRVTVVATGPGRHMVYATNVRPVAAGDYAWESDFTTLTFEVGAR